MGKCRYENIGIPAANGLFTPVNQVLGWEPSWVNLAKFTYLRQLVSGMQQLQQEEDAQLTKCTEFMPWDPEYM